ncbi:MAG: hypothetical protein O3B95_02730 [Chloroflexi bacterium]|nr:hypothetical protein [Chloroflexota bacterium]
MKSSKNNKIKDFSGSITVVFAVVVLLVVVASCSSGREPAKSVEASDSVGIPGVASGVVSEGSLLCLECELIDVIEVVDANTVRTSLGDIQMYGAYVLDQPSDCAALSHDRLRELVGDSFRIEPGPADSIRNDSDHFYMYTSAGKSIEEALVRDGLALVWNLDGQHIGWFLFRDSSAKKHDTGCLWKGYNAFQRGEPSEFRVPGLTYPSNEQIKGSNSSGQLTLRWQQISSAQNFSWATVPSIPGSNLIQPKFKSRSLYLTVTIVGVIFAIVQFNACGGTLGDEQKFPQISDSGQVISVETLQATSFKESSVYSTEGLPGATYVSYGFLRVGSGDPYEYEVRFYDSHQQAVELGTRFAIEGSGNTAILDADEATYKDGVKNRRVIIGSGVGGGARSGIGPKFGGYAVFENIVMLCQGSDEAQSIERCALLANALVPGA